MENMKMYVVVTITEDDQGLNCITWHRHLHIMKEMALADAFKKENSCVLVLEQVDSYSSEQVRAWGLREGLGNMDENDLERMERSEK